MIFAKQTWNWLWSEVPTKVKSRCFHPGEELNSKLMSELRNSNILILWRLSPGTACPSLLESTIHQPRRKIKLRKKALMRNHFPAVFSARVFSVFSFSDDVMHQELLSWVKYLNMKCISRPQHPANESKSWKFPPTRHPSAQLRHWHWNCSNVSYGFKSSSILTSILWRIHTFWFFDSSLLPLHWPLRMIIGEQVFS